ncbi:hypothetical protein [Bacillus spongiae]|uniref:SunI/YnzG family protein n=1 Tax=Bacillus spongiae TaxID=2683610 RepID=UPI003AF8D292
MEIPLSEITNVDYDYMYGGKNKLSIRIDNSYASTDTVVINTKKILTYSSQILVVWKNRYCPYVS